MSGFRPVRAARPVSARAAARPPSDAPRPPKPPKLPKVDAKPYPDPYPFEGIDWRTKPLTEFVTAWVLVKQLGAKLGEDFLYQQIIPAKGVNISGKGFRSDFWLLNRGRFGPFPPPYTRGRILDPVSVYTHPHTGEDRFRRGALAQAGYDLVWVDDTQLYLNPIRMIRDAVRGIDHSSIARGAR